MKTLQLPPSWLPSPKALAAASESRDDDLKINILLIDDQPANLVALESLLASDGYSIVKASSGPEALRKLLEQDFALILLDVIMPEMDGFETAALIRRRPLTKDTPIIFITAANTNDEQLGRGYSLGAVDYIHKPIVPEILKAKVHVFADLYRKTQRLIVSEKALRNELDAHRRTMAAHGESEERWRQVFSRASDAIFLFDPTDGAILDANHAATNLYGYTRRELFRLRVEELGVKPPRSEPLGDAAQARDAKAARLFQKSKDGRVFPVEIMRRSLPSQGRKTEMLMVRDMTENLKALEAERLREREAMQRKMITTVSHELRTPIAAIKASAETLHRGGLGIRQTMYPRLLKIIESQADRLSGIVEDLLIIAEIEAGKVAPSPRDVAFKPFVNKFIKTIVSLATRKGVSIRLDAPEDLVVWIDPEHLSRILQNLLDNAIKYNKKDGKVLLSARRVDRDTAQISIKDTGIGIAPDELPRIFQQFFRTQKAKDLAIKGSGLGLSILKTLVESNRGKIWAESVLDRGSTFHFTAPLAPRTGKIS